MVWIGLEKSIFDTFCYHFATTIFPTNQKIPPKNHLSALKKLKKMNKNVKVVFDRRKRTEKTGTGSIEICVYLKPGERKYTIAICLVPFLGHMILRLINRNLHVRLLTVVSLPNTLGNLHV